MEIKYYVDDKGLKRIVSDPDDLPRFIEDPVEYEKEINRPIKRKEAIKRFLGVLFRHKVQKTLDRL